MRYQHSVRSWLGMLVVLSLLAGSMPSAAQDPADSAEEGPAAAETVPASTEPVYDEDIAFLSKGAYECGGTPLLCVCFQSLTRLKISCWTQTACMKQSTPHRSAD